MKEIFGLSVDNFKADNYTKKSDTNKKIKERLLEGFLNNRISRYQWLGKMPNAEGYWYVDFDITACFSLDSIDLEQRIAIIQSPLRESIPTRYSDFMGRIGLPWENAERLEVANELFDYLKKQ